MKKLLLLLFIALLTISLTSCGSVSMAAFEKYAYIKSWAYREMPPSQVVTNGEVFYEGKLYTSTIKREKKYLIVILTIYIQATKFSALRMLGN